MLDYLGQPLNQVNMLLGGVDRANGPRNAPQVLTFKSMTMHPHICITEGLIIDDKDGAASVFCVTGARCGGWANRLNHININFYAHNNLLGWKLLSPGYCFFVARSNSITVTTVIFVTVTKLLSPKKLDSN